MVFHYLTNAAHKIPSYTNLLKTNPFFSLTENRLNCNKSLAGFLIDIYCRATKIMH